MGASEVTEDNVPSILLGRRVDGDPERSGEDESVYLLEERALHHEPPLDHIKVEVYVRSWPGKEANINGLANRGTNCHSNYASRELRKMDREDSKARAS